MELELLDNIQFIYELALARLELESLAGSCDVLNGLRHFSVPEGADPALLTRRTAYFKNVSGKPTLYSQLQSYNITRSVNQYLTHWIYPYKGKYHPQMIRALVNIMGIQRGEVILDPFIGSGTTAVECELMGVKCIGIDISPLCVLISKVKTESLFYLDRLEKAAKDVEKHIQQNDLFLEGMVVREADRPYLPQKINEDEPIKNFFTVAEMIAHSDRERRRKDFDESFHLNVDKMLRSVRMFSEASKKYALSLCRPQIIKADARRLDLPDESVDGIITSPPYSIALNYVENDAHALRALGYDLSRIRDDFVGVRGTGMKKFDLYYEDMFRAYSEMYRVLRKGRYCSVVVGNVTLQNEEVDTTDRAIRDCGKLGFKLEHKIDKIIFGLYNIMQREFILIFRKE